MLSNEFFVFPYNSVPAGSKIIIYGAGRVGHSFYNQLKITGFCEVIAIADREAETDSEARVYTFISPQKIKEYDFDFVVLALGSVGVARRVRNELIEDYHIDENKIVECEPKRVGTSFSIRPLAQLLDFESLNNELYEFHNSYSGDISYFASTMREMQKISQTDEGKRIKEYFDDSINRLTIDNKVIILRFLNYCGLFDKENMRQFVNVALDTKDFNNAMWMLMDISSIECNNPDSRYSEYYNDKRNAIEKITKPIFSELTDIKTDYRENSVVIVMNSMMKVDSSHCSLVIPYANELAKQGKKVKIVPMDIFRFRYGEASISPLSVLEQESFLYENDHKKALDSSIEVFYNRGTTMLERCVCAINAIADFMPEYVIDMCSEYSFLSPIINRIFPIINIPMRGYSSSSSFDYYISRSRDICLSENKIYNSMAETQVKEALVCSLPKKESSPYKRKKYELDENDFVLTTVGIRLNKEITENMADYVCKFLKNHDNAKWILVGGRLPSFLKREYSELFSSRKIIDWGFEDDLPAFYGLCDCYWNPVRTGAGGSIVDAMRKGVVVVTTDYPSDALPRIGIENTVKTIGQCYEKVERLYSDREYFLEQSNLMINRMNISSVSEYIRKISQFGAEARASRK